MKEYTKLLGNLNIYRKLKIEEKSELNILDNNIYRNNRYF